LKCKRLKRKILTLIIASLLLGACDDYLVSDENISKIYIIGDNVSSLRAINSQGKSIQDTIWYLDSFDQLYYAELSADTNEVISVDSLAITKKNRFYQFTRKVIESSDVICDEGVLNINETLGQLESSRILAAKALSYYGAIPSFINDSLLMVPILYSPKGDQLSQEWFANAGRYGRVVIVDKKNCVLEIPFKFENALEFNPLLEHPIIAHNQSKIYYCQVHDRAVYEWDIKSKEVRKINISGKKITLDKYDFNKLNDRKYNLSYYQRSQFVTGLWVDLNGKHLIRQIKKSQKEKDENGLNIPPYMSDMVFELIDISSGEIVKRIEINGEIYSSRKCFFRKELIYVQNKKDSNSDTLVYNGFLLNQRM